MTFHEKLRGSGDRLTGGLAEFFPLLSDLSIRNIFMESRMIDVIRSLTSSFSASIGDDQIYLEMSCTHGHINIDEPTAEIFPLDILLKLMEKQKKQESWLFRDAFECHT
jgi:hypothetical protein